VTSPETYSDRDNDELDESLAGSTPYPDKARRGWFAGGRGVLIGVGIGIAIALAGTRFLAKPAAQPAAKQPATAAVAGTVTVAPVEMGRVARTIDTTGTVAASDLLPVLSQATGLQIQKVLVEEGDTVTQGQVMATLDNSVLQSQLNQAQAQLQSARAVVRQKQATWRQAQATLAEAQRNLARYRSLADQGAISRQDLDTRSTTVATAREAVGVAQADINSAQADVQNGTARVEQLLTQIEQTQVRAPANGIVAEKIARIGDVSSGSQKLFSIIRNGFLELQVKVPETQLPQIRLGAPVQITSDADNRLRLQGRVREIAPLVNEQTRQATVKIDLPPTNSLRPGMFARAAITSQMVQGMTVPAGAVLPQAEGGKSIVYVLQDPDKVRAQPVETGERMAGERNDPATARVEVKQGLKVGDRVVVTGAGYLKDGDRVQVVDQPTPPNADTPQTSNVP
jgi:RND family efflux transporter MFP subunit